jgi:hypothetical protein
MLTMAVLQRAANDVSLAEQHRMMCVVGDVVVTPWGCDDRPIAHASVIKPYCGYETSLQPYR